MTPPTNKVLLRNIELLHDAAGRGDPVAKVTIDGFREKAAAGDLGALAAVNTFRVVGYQRQNAEQWSDAGVMHERLVAGDPEALAWLKALNTSAVAGVEKAITTLNMLSAHTDKHYASAWARPDDGEAQDENTRTRNVTPMSLGQHPHRRAFAVGNMVVGATPAATKTTAKFLVLTPAAEQQLIKMMQLGAQSRPVLSDVAAHALANLAPTPLAEASICAQARAAVARNSPAASMLVAQCNAESGRQVLTPVAAATVMPTSDGITLGRTKPPPVHLGRVGTSTLSSAQMGLQGICDRAADAKKRNSPGYPALLQACMVARQSNVTNGLFIADSLPTGGADGSSPQSVGLRMAMTNAGNVVVAKNSKMAQFRASLPAAEQRGFTMAMGARAGQVDPKFIAFLTPALAGDPELLKGFLDGMNM